MQCPIIHPHDCAMNPLTEEPEAGEERIETDMTP